MSATYTSDFRIRQWAEGLNTRRRKRKFVFRPAKTIPAQLRLSRPATNEVKKKQASHTHIPYWEAKEDTVQTSDRIPLL